MFPLISISVGLGAIGLGLKGFSTEGLHVSENRRITGTPAIIIGIICLLVGIALIAVGVYLLVTGTRV